MPTPFVTRTTGPRIKTWGGWYRHTTIELNGRIIGRVQTRLRGGRFNTITLDTNSACVLGDNVDWLVRRSQETAP